MFLRNFDNWLIGLTGFANPGNNSTNYISNSVFINQAGQFGDGCVNMKWTSGSISAFQCGRSYPPDSISLGKCNICLGTGTEPVTYEDYKLSGSVIDNNKLTYQSHEFTYNPETHKFKKRVTFTYANTGSTDLVVSEWGLFMYSSNTGSITFNNNSGSYALMYREVLPEPFTIPKGVTSTITFEAEFPMMHRI